MTRHTQGQLTMTVRPKEVFIEAGSGAERMLVIVSTDDRDRDIALANAARIVLAWNLFDELRALAESIAEALEGSEDPQEEVWWNQATKIIQKAKPQ